MTHSPLSEILETLLRNLGAFAASANRRFPSLRKPSPAVSAIIFALVAVCVSPVRAEDAPLEMFPISGGVQVSEIRVDGAQRLEKETVLSYLTVAKGEEVTSENVDASMKALYATGLFSDIAITVEGSTLVVTVSENPIINRVAFEGNDAISTEDLEKEVQIKPRLVYTLPRVQRDVQRVLELYRRSGRFAAVVEPKLVKLEQNRVDVVFEISEGKHTGVSRIRFVGNDHFSESDLRGVINTRESAWWRILSTVDFYDPDRTSYDRDLLRRFYLNEGYLECRVTSAVAELSPDRKDFFLTFSVDEGQRYRFGKISIQSDIKGLDGETLRQDIFSKQGDWYSAEVVERSVNKLTATLGDRQYAFAEVTPEMEKNRETSTVDILFRVKEGPQVYVGTIDIKGNSRTLDKVIRREIMLAESDPFSVSKMRRSEQRVKDLGFFEEAKITPADGAQPDRANLEVQVKEKATGEISFGAGFSSTDGPLGDFNIRERNFLGKGQDAKIGATVSGTTKQIDLSFTEPYFLDRDLSAGFDIFHVIRDNQTQSSYDQTDTGFSLRAGFPLSEEMRQRLSYTLQKTDISNVSTLASRFIREQEGESITSMVGQEISYDTRDSRLEPTSGLVVRLNTDLAGLGGDRKFARFRVVGSKYYEIYEKIVLSGTAETGYIFGLGEDTRINDRFFLGGDTLRGFEFAGIGPRDLTGGAQDALGGNRFSRGSLEITSPLPIPGDLSVKGHIFADAGILGDNPESPLAGEVFKNDESLRASVGIGATWISPFGPIRLDLATPLMKESYDRTEVVHFSFGTHF